jgi:hypothetical protein
MRSIMQRWMTARGVYYLLDAQPFTVRLDKACRAFLWP